MVMKVQRREWLQLLMVGAVAGWLTAGAWAEDKKDAPSATGTWKSSFTNQNGDKIETTYKLKQDGDKLTGTVTGRDGKEVMIENGKVTDGEVSFDVTREFQGQKIEIHYKGKVTADAITGKSEFKRGDQTRSRDWKATREKAEKETMTSGPVGVPALAG
jgi:hypothetical protein